MPDFARRVPATELSLRPDQALRITALSQETRLLPIAGPLAAVFPKRCTDSVDPPFRFGIPGQPIDKADPSHVRMMAGL